MHGDELTRDDWRQQRFERDLSDLRTDVKAGLKEVNTSVANLQASIQGLQVALPLTYVTRVDLQDRMKFMEEQLAVKVEAQSKQIADMQATMRQLIFAIIGALISGGLALLIEVLKLLGGGKT